MKRSTRMRQRAAAVAEFRDAYAELVKAGRGAGEDVKRRVAYLAGRAAVAAGDYELKLQVRHPFMGRASFPVIQGWESAFDHPLMVDPAGLLKSYDQIVGSLEGEADRFAASEQTLAGRIAAVIRLPAEVRSLLAEEFPESPGFARAGFAATVALELAAVVVGGVATAVVVAWLKQWWSLLA